MVIRNYWGYGLLKHVLISNSQKRARTIILPNIIIIVVICAYGFSPENMFISSPLLESNNSSKKSEQNSQVSQREWGKVSSGLRCSIATEKTLWSKGTPIFIPVIIENTTDNNIHFDGIPLARLYKDYQDKEKSQVDASEIEREKYTGASSTTALFYNTKISPFLSNLNLKGHEFLDFKIDLNMFVWQRDISAMLPNSPLYDVVLPGKYKLLLTIQIIGNPIFKDNKADNSFKDLLYSNEVKVTISE
jgi:hypothetical protein